MSDSVTRLLATFEQLSAEDQEAFAKAIIARIDSKQLWATPADDDYLVAAGEQTFMMYDEEERQNGATPSS